MAGKKILIIEADRNFASDLSKSLGFKGFDTALADNGKEGLEAVRKERPDLIVLCVELPMMSGYSVCNKLKKDADLKDVPLIIMSSEATPETFEQHKKLKTHAEDYLIKPFEPQKLIESIGRLLKLPAGGEAAPGGGEDEVELKIGEDAIVEEEIPIDGARIEEEIPLSEEDIGHLAAEAHGKPEPARGDHGHKEGDVFREDDLKFLDNAFDNILEPQQRPATGSRPAPRPEPKAAPRPPVHEEEIDLSGLGDTAADDLSIDDQLKRLSAPETDDESAADLGHALAGKPAPKSEPKAAAADGAVQSENRALKEQVESLRKELASVKTQLEEAGRKSRPPSANITEEINRLRGELRKKDDLLREETDKGHKQGDKVADLIAEIGGKQDEIHKLQEEMEEKSRDADERVNTLLEQISSMSGDLDKLRADNGGLESKLKSAEMEARSRAEEAEARHNKDVAQKNLHIRELEDKINDLQGNVNRLVPFEYEAGQLREEVESLSGRIKEAEEAITSKEQEVGDLRQQLEAATESGRKNEERFMKAYNKIKNDARVRDKASKAIEIALQLLSEKKGDSDAGF
ncbi:MAG: response regulator [Deltaproteobacteria bacterium]|nr:response regulator [Deltaproteobacteria bacterium]